MHKNRLGGHEPQELDIKQYMQSLLDMAEPGDMPDTYGEGESLNAFEQSVASLFGFEAGVFMPSGTMAQQIALRQWADEKNNPLIAMHPTAHLETAEQLGYQHLHRLRRVQFGVPEMINNRPLQLSDLESLAEIPAVLLLELPMRPLGGLLPSWDELLKIREWCDQHKVKLHLDGARIWSCRPHFQKSFEEIGALFDSVYVSFYKDIGGLCGCVLMGDKAFIAQSKIWQRRHGGNLINQFTSLISAKHGLETRLPQMESWVLRAQQIAALMNEVPGVKTQPSVPHCNIFRVFLKGDSKTLMERHKQLEDETNTRLFGGMSDAEMPGWSVAEVHCWENAMTFDETQLTSFLKKLVQTP